MDGETWHIRIDLPDNDKEVKARLLDHLRNIGADATRSRDRSIVGFVVDADGECADRVRDEVAAAAPYGAVVTLDRYAPLLEDAGQFPRLAETS